MDTGGDGAREPLKLLTDVAEQLENFDRGQLTTAEVKTVDLAARDLRLIVYSRRLAADPGHRGWVADVQRQIATGVLDEPGLDVDDLRKLVFGR